MHRGNKIGGKAVEDLLRKNPEAFGGRRAGAAGGEAAGQVPSGLQERLLPEIMDLNYNDAKESFEKYYLEIQLSKNSGIISRTAEAIGIYPSNLHAKLRKYHINNISNTKEER
jgi:two-component system nitrogen regulation response regulator NtrX